MSTNKASQETSISHSPFITKAKKETPNEVIGGGVISHTVKSKEKIGEVPPIILEETPTVVEPINYIEKNVYHDTTVFKNDNVPLVVHNKKKFKHKTREVNKEDVTKAGNGKQTVFSHTVKAIKSEPIIKTIPKQLRILKGLSYQINRTLVASRVP